MVVMAFQKPECKVFVVQSIRYQVFMDYLDKLERRQRGKSTKENFKGAVRHLEAWMEEQGLEIQDLTSELMEAYFEQLPLAPSTKRLHLNQIGAAFRYAHRRGVISRDPTVDVQLPAVADTPPRNISNQDLKRLLAAAVTEPEHTMLMLLMFTGMRRFEVAELTWGDSVDLPGTTLRVVGKGGKLRLIPIHPALGETLNALPFKFGYVVAGPGGGVSLTAMVARLKRLNERAGTETTFHDFRRTVASSLHHNGVDGDIIDKIMGWAPVNIRTKFYQRTADERLHEAILRLYADEPVV